MSNTAKIALTEKQRKSIFKELSRFDLFKDSPHVPVKGISGWPPAEKEDSEKREAVGEKD